ncbi:MAG: OstA family protein [Pseudanabaena sp. CRU_2_10]|nr:OstA family protein [Pseudanabaena sp. CRU_2_10]
MNVPQSNPQIILLLLPLAMLFGSIPAPASSQNSGQNTALTIRADIQEANSKTGIVTARGNVRMKYPARQINATSAQARYFSKERRIILSGNVIVTQQGNSIKAETITYLIDEGKFEALPPDRQQVESVYIVPDDGDTSSVAKTTPVAQIKPAFKPPSKGLVSPVIVPTPKKEENNETGKLDAGKPGADRPSQEVENSPQPQQK